MRSFDCLNTWTQCGQVSMVQSGGYKLQMDMMGKGFMYNLASDPLETVNLWDDSDYAKTKAAMFTLLTSEMLKR